MKTSFKLLLAVCSFMWLQSCYEEYKFDYTHTTAYFARQKPLRTLVEEEGKNMCFTFGVVLSGVYSNEKDWKVEFEIAPELLDDYSEMKLLPEDYYSLSDNRNIVIPAGKILGEIEVKMDKEKFMNDPLALTGVYALPIRIVHSETDSILENADYTIIAVKYVNKYHGHYWVKGEDSKYDSSGTLIDTETYSSADLVTNRRATLVSKGRNTLSIPYIGRFNSDGYSMMLKVDNAGEVKLVGDIKSSIKEVAGAGTYDEGKNIFAVEYSYTDGDGYKDVVKDELIFSNLELKLEEW